MVTTRKDGRASADGNNAEAPRAPVASNDPSHVENEASSHPSWRDEAPAPPAPPQPSLRGEASEPPSHPTRPAHSADYQGVARAPAGTGGSRRLDRPHPGIDRHCRRPIGWRGRARALPSKDVLRPRRQPIPSTPQWSRATMRNARGRSGAPQGHSPGRLL